MTNAGLLRILALLEDDVSHIGVSSGNSPTVGSTTLDGEYARKIIAEKLIDGYTLVVDGFFDETEAHGTITGWGAYGDGAGGGVGTGTLIAATSANIEKTEHDSLTLSAEITIRRVET